MLEKLQSQPAPDQLPDLNEGSDTDNEFVKQYLEQRQKVFAAQMEARRRLEGMLAWLFYVKHFDPMVFRWISPQGLFDMVNDVLFRKVIVLFLGYCLKKLVALAKML